MAITRIYLFILGWNYAAMIISITNSFANQQILFHMVYGISDTKLHAFSHAIFFLDLQHFQRVLQLALHLFLEEIFNKLEKRSTFQKTEWHQSWGASVEKETWRTKRILYRNEYLTNISLTFQCLNVTQNSSMYCIHLGHSLVRDQTSHFNYGCV